MFRFVVRQRLDPPAAARVAIFDFVEGFEWHSVVRSAVSGG
jgi:hypothetical protein